VPLGDKDHRKAVVRVKYGRVVSRRVRIGAEAAFDQAQLSCWAGMGIRGVFAQRLRGVGVHPERLKRIDPCLL
jgi:hypothetical protein